MKPQRPSVAGTALTHLVLEVFRLNGRLLAAGDRMTRPAGQTSARWQVLGAIDPGPRTVSQIARVMGLTRQSVQRTADRLQSEGIVSYVDNPAHRRAKLVALTARGRSVLAGITRRQVVWANELGARLDEADLRRALRTVHAFREILEDPDRLGPTGPARGRPAAQRGPIPHRTGEAPR
jgi:DNA-binding MarR family transcriptional regulator